MGLREVSLIMWISGRWLKPPNLLVGMTMQGAVVKITDFGLGSGKAASRDAHFSSMVMEVTRIAPEQFNPKEYGVEGSVSYHVDFWALAQAAEPACRDDDAGRGGEDHGFWIGVGEGGVEGCAF